MDISLVTSLYRAEPHLAGYCARAQALIRELNAAGLTPEIILVANVPTDAEKAHLHDLIAWVEQRDTEASITLLEVPLETVYASWNRGFQLARGRCVGPWNVDDIRFVGALTEGHALITAGHALVYFPYTAIHHTKLLGRLPITRRVAYKAPPFNKEHFARAMRGASFWLCDRALFEQVGPFDAHFRISGDFEWFTRALTVTDFHPGQQHGGEFHLHGRNLSDTGNPRQVVENNIIHMRRQAWEFVVPARPDVMRDCWEQWGNPGIDVPKHIQDKLWGPGAYKRWRAWLRQRRIKRLRTQLSETLRIIPRFIIDRTNLRPYFAKLGIVKSATPNH